MKNSIWAVLVPMFALIACKKNENATSLQHEENVVLINDCKDEVAIRLLSASLKDDFIDAMFEEATISLGLGLEESIYLDKVFKTTISKGANTTSRLIRERLNTSHVCLKSEDDNIIFNGLEIYWPYSSRWDKISHPVIVINKGGNEQYLVDDKTYAYRIQPDNNIEKIIIDEAYAMENPVWVINDSDVPLNDIENLCNKEYTKTSYIPRNALQNTKASSNICELVANTIKSTKQHDDWLNGGSEYIIHWFFPYGSKQDELKVNTTAQIKISRDEISKGKTRTINFVGNFDWAKEQRYNKIKVIEFDPGKDKDIPIKLSVEIKGVKTSIETKIPTNVTDEMIMEYEIPRQAMFTEKTIIDETHYSKSFYGDGVTVSTTIEAIKSLAEL